MKVNASLAKQGKDFDAGYSCSLSADALPSLIGVLDDLPQAKRAEIKKHVSKRWKRTNTDWRQWNAARERARSETRRLLRTRNF